MSSSAKKGARVFLVGAMGAVAALLALQPVAAQQKLSVVLEGLLPSGNLPISSAFCLPKGSDQKPRDESPGMHWSSGPAGTKSYVVIMVDPDVTADLSLMNKPGVTIRGKFTAPEYLPLGTRRHSHWCARARTGCGRRWFRSRWQADRSRSGRHPRTNDYWPLFNKSPNGPPEMKGPYGQYDGPCPRPTTS